MFSFNLFFQVCPCVHESPGSQTTYLMCCSDQNLFVKIDVESGFHQIPIQRGR
ncbi:hypothetical protein HanIR_Chr09g0398661 [Helianthus annuus]|nr:hypothetical protein HanIR_Chr09g0398661 [Helianthus annuus]